MVDLKDAVFMMAKAWDNVSQATIRTVGENQDFQA